MHQVLQFRNIVPQLALFGATVLWASSFIALNNLIPVVSVILAWLILGEMLNRNQLIAAGVVMFGVWLTQQSPAAGRG